MEKVARNFTQTNVSWVEVNINPFLAMEVGDGGYYRWGRLNPSKLMFT